MTLRTDVRIRWIALAAAAAFALAGTAGASAQDGKPWRHGIIEAKSDAGILFMAQKGGFAAKLGLDLQFVQVKTDQIGLKALLAGELDSYEGGPGGAILAAARGADVRIIGCHWVTVPHGIFVHDDITSVAQLKGKSIAVSSPGTMPEMLAREALAKYGVPVAEVKFASLGGDLDRYKALLARVVEAAVVSAEYTPVAAKNGLKLLVPGREALPKFLRICLHSSARTIAERPADAVRFLTAEMQGLRYALAHKDETVALARELTGAKADDPRPVYIYDLAVETSAVAPELPIPLDRLAWLQDQLVAGGSLNKAGDIAKLVDGSLRAKTLELVGH
jgi:NitT/TauT family transport system substrate-binding protein